MRPVPGLLPLLFIFVLFPFRAAAAPPEAMPHLTVHGIAQVSLPADQARLNLAVVTHAATSKAALAANSRSLAAVEAALHKAGLAASEYRTGRFEIRPDWAPHPRDAGPEWRPAITGYTVSNSLQITTGKLDRLGALIEAGVAAGVNSVDSLVFDLADPAAGRAEAIARATRNARDEAQAAASAAGVRLGAIGSIEVEPGAESAPQRMLRVAAAEPVPPLSPGEVTIRAGVTMVYGFTAN